jgi:hypothetical protein
MNIERTVALEAQAGQAIQHPRMPSSRPASDFGKTVLTRAERLIRLYPIPLLVLGFGIGYLVAREITR